MSSSYIIDYSIRYVSVLFINFSIHSCIFYIKISYNKNQIFKHVYLILQIGYEIVILEQVLVVETGFCISLVCFLLHLEDFHSVFNFTFILYLSTENSVFFPKDIDIDFAHVFLETDKNKLAGSLYQLTARYPAAGLIPSSLSDTVAIIMITLKAPYQLFINYVSYIFILLPSCTTIHISYFVLYHLQ